MTKITKPLLGFMFLTKMFVWFLLYEQKKLSSKPCKEQEVTVQEGKTISEAVYVHRDREKEELPIGDNKNGGQAQLMCWHCGCQS